MNNEVKNGLYRLLPSLNDLLLMPGVELLIRSYSRDAVVRSIRSTLGHIRQEISEGSHTRTSLIDRVTSLSDSVAHELERNAKFSLRPVINATGVILHTNLGRAPLSQSALDHMVEIARGYSNLELDLASGERGSRDAHIESLMLQVLATKTGLSEPSQAHRAIVVNNCAAATFLALNTLAEGKEVLVSRGELVEIGGGFRIPEILGKSGATLREVGTTNRTRLTDYEHAISSNTGLILRVHQSNFSMEGFVARPQISELVALGKRANIPVFEDQGTGLIVSLEEYGILSEATLVESYRQDCHLIAASGDKLFGGPQCGLLIGKQDLIERIRKNPLFRTYRVDKLTYAALEATWMDYLSGDTESLPIVRMLNLSKEEILHRCQWVADQIRIEDPSVDVVPVMSLIGGGTAPGARLPSYAVSLRHSIVSADILLLALRQFDPPVIARISEDRVLLDLRTVDADFDASLVSLLRNHLTVLQPDFRAPGKA